MSYKKTRFRRRRENKTDYHARLLLLQSRRLRLVVRKSNRYIIAQIVESREARDFVKLAASSSELKKYGWPASQQGSLKSIPAAYLTGVLLADKIRFSKSGIDELILDIGLARSTKGSRIYSVVKGLIDSGIKVKCSQDMLPSQERVAGKNIKNKISIEDIKGRIK